MFTTPEFPPDVPRMTDSEREQFVAGLLDGSIFTSMHIHEIDKKKGDLGRVFMPQGNNVFQLAPKSFLENIAVLWEFMKDKSAVVHKGSVTKVSYPKFLTCRTVSLGDWDLSCESVRLKKGDQGLIVTP
jgi:hypothetical protein